MNDDIFVPGVTAGDGPQELPENFLEVELDSGNRVDDLIREERMKEQNNLAETNKNEEEGCGCPDE